MKDGSKVNFKDESHRKKVIEALKKIKPEWDVISNEYEFMIDLQILNHSKYVAIEIENGQWEGEYIQDYRYSNFLRNGNPQIKVKTLNRPPRKHHYWINGDHYYTKGKYVGEFWYTETDADKNIFLRTNEDVTQIFIAYPEVMNDRKKVLYSSKQSSKITTGEVELWTAIPLEYVEIWNLNPTTNEWVLYIYKPITITDELRLKLRQNAV
jgi:hypothetical protein